MTRIQPVNSSPPFFWFLGQIPVSTILIMVLSALLFSSVFSVAVLPVSSQILPPYCASSVDHKYIGRPLAEVPEIAIFPPSNCALTFSKNSKNASSPLGTTTVESSASSPIFLNSSTL